jgi:hypothetical protein
VAEISVIVSSSSGESNATATVQLILSKPASDSNPVVGATIYLQLSPALSISNAAAQVLTSGPSVQLPPNGSVSCGLPQADQINCVLNSIPATAIPAGTYVLANITLNLATPGLVNPVDFRFLECFDAKGNEILQSCRAHPGNVDIMLRFSDGFESAE